MYPPEVKGEDNCFVSPSIVGAPPAATAATVAPPTSCVVSSSSSSDRSQHRKEEKGQKKGNKRPRAGADPTLRERVRKEVRETGNYTVHAMISLTFGANFS